MKKYAILLAEERETITSLLKRAINDSPTHDRTDNLYIAHNASDLEKYLDYEPSILLLSSTFSEKDHNEHIVSILTKHPRLKVISLHHRYSERSPLKHGAFAVIDKPVRNPVLWAKIKESMDALDAEGMSSELNLEPETDSNFILLDVEEEETIETPDSFHVEHQKSVLFHVEPEDSFHVKHEVDTNQSVEPKASSDTPFIVDDGDDFDPFATPPAPKPTKNTRNEPTILILDDEEDTAPLNVVHKETTSLKNETMMYTEEQTFLITPEAEEDESNVEVAQQDVEQPPVSISVDMDTEMTSPVTPIDIQPVIEPHRTTLEPISEIFQDEDAYDKKSKWTKADEGFVSKNGQFVTLAPPRPQVINGGASAKRVENEPSLDGGKLFGSVKRLFKK